MPGTLFKLVRTTAFRFSSISIMFLLLLIVIAYQHLRFISYDVMPKIEQVDAKTQKLAVNVEVGCHIFNFPEFSFKTPNFLMDAVVWFKIPVASIDLRVIEQFTIQNSLLQGWGLLYHSAPIIKIIGNEILVSYHVQTKFTGEFQYRDFPLSDHTLHLIIQNRSVVPEEICFHAKKENLSFSQRTFHSWSVKNVTATTGFMGTMLQTDNPNFNMTYPVAIFSIDFNEDGLNNLFSLYFPLFILFFIALFSLFFEIDDTQRIANIISLVPALVLFKLVINSVAPDISYITHIDLLFYALVGLSLCIMLFQMYAMLVLQQIKTLSSDAQVALKNSLRNKNDILFIFTLIVLFVVICWLLVR